LFNQITEEGRDFEMNTSKLCCHWCKIPLGNATQVTYLNGNLPICDLCLGTAQAQILSAFAEKDKKIAELESENLSLRQDKAIVDNYVKELEAQVEKMKKAIDIRDRIME